MGMRTVILTATTTAGGAATVNAPTGILGKLYAILYKPGTLDTGATITVTCEGMNSKPLLTKTTAGTVDTLFYPRDLVNGVADGAALTGAAGGDRTMPLLIGIPRLVVASGGDTMTGSVVLYYEV
jgi:hypothetical protein